MVAEESARGLPGFVNLVGIDSPGLTSSLAIAEEVETAARVTSAHNRGEVCAGSLAIHEAWRYSTPFISERGCHGQTARFEFPFVVGRLRRHEAGPIRKHARPIAGSYIVVLREDAARGPLDAFSRQPSVEDLATEMVDIPGLGRRKHLYQHALRGFSCRRPRSEAERIADDSRVAFVEEDGVVEAAIVQSSPTWGLDRVDQRALPLSQATGTTRRAPASTPT